MAVLGLITPFSLNKKSPQRAQALLRRLLEASPKQLENASAFLNLFSRRTLLSFYKHAHALLKNKVLSDLPSSEFTTKDFFSGVYGGLIQSRLYYGSKTIGSFDTPSGSQSFSLVSHKGKRDKFNGSLGQIMQSKLGESLTLRNGSSYATHELVPELF
jgi:hypothetical protein